MEPRKSSYMIRSWREAKNLNKTEMKPYLIGNSSKMCIRKMQVSHYFFWEGIRARSANYIWLCNERISCCNKNNQKGQL